MRRSYYIQIRNINDTALPGKVLLQFSSNPGTNPQGRIYLDGGSPPAYTNIPGSWNVDTGHTLAAGIYVVEFKNDEDGERVLAKVQVRAWNDTCFSQNGPSSYKELYVDVNIAVVATGIIITHSIGIINLFNVLVDRSRSVSIDGGTTWKSINLANNQAFWSNAELESLEMLYDIPTVHARRDSNACTKSYATDWFVEELTYPELVASGIVTNETSADADDGTITLSISGGSGEYETVWNDGPTTQNRSGLAAGTYWVTVTDLITEEEIILEFLVTQPEVVPQPAVGSILRFPFMNSIHWVVEPVTDPDNVTTFQTPDNTLFCHQYYPGYQQTQWYQKLQTADKPVQQFDSDFLNHLIELRSMVDESVVKIFDVELKEQNIGITEDFPITIRNHTEANQSRVYFTQGLLPIPLSVGKSFEILNNLTGFNGVYTIVAIEIDVSLGYQYLVINKTYAIPASSTPGTGRFDTSVLNYNVYEFVPDFDDVDPGKYYFYCKAFNAEDNFKEAITEPIDLKVLHRDCVLIEWRNEDNSNDLTYTTGIIGLLRMQIIHGVHRKPGGEFSTSRDSDFSLVMNRALMIRGFKLPIHMAPPYMHEKLAVVFKSDFWYINKVQYQSNAAYPEPQYIDQFKLANAEIDVEQKGWFTNHNSDELGSIADDGFLLLGQGGYLKL